MKVTYYYFLLYACYTYLSSFCVLMCYARDKINKIWLVLVLKELSLELNCPLDTCGNLNLVKLNTIKNSSSHAVGTFQMLSSHMWPMANLLDSVNRDYFHHCGEILFEKADFQVFLLRIRYFVTF